MKSINPSEYQIQAAFIEYVEAKYPDLTPLLIHIPNEGQRSLAGGVRQKKLGLRAGIPDLFFAKPSRFKSYMGNRWNGLFIEVKSKGKKPTKLQLEYLNLLNKESYYTAWHDNIDDIIETFEAYLIL